MSKGFVKLHRKLSSWKYSTNPQAFRIWVELIMSATHKPYKSGSWTLKKGQWKGSASYLSKTTGVSRPTVNKWLNTFEEDKMIRRYTLPNNQGVIYTILKYDQYQNSDEEGCQIIGKGAATILAAHKNNRESIPHKGEILSSIEPNEHLIDDEEYLKQRRRKK